MCIYESRVDAVTCFQSRQDSFPAGYIVGHVPHLTSGVTRSCTVLHTGRCAIKSCVYSQLLFRVDFTTI